MVRVQDQLDRSLPAVAGMRQPAMGLNNSGGKSYVVDNCCDTDNFVAAGVDNRIHDGLFYSYPAGHRNRRGVDWGHSGAKARLAVSISVTTRIGLHPDRI